MSKEGIVYFIQPVILLGTNRYKIGCGSNMSRLNSYHSGTRHIEIIKCKDYFTVEKEIIKRFKEKFILCGGKEYFEGDEEEMKNEFCEIVSKFITTNTTENTIDNTTDTHIKTSDENIIYDEHKNSKFSCIKCSYFTNDKQGYDKHCLSKKHNTNNYEDLYVFNCDKCNKKYKSTVGIWRHKKVCNQSHEMKPCENMPSPTQNIENQLNELIDIVKKLVDKKTNPMSTQNNIV